MTLMWTCLVKNRGSPTHWCGAYAILHVCELLGCWSTGFQALQFKAMPKAQVMLQLLGAFSAVQHPLALHLTGGTVSHCVTLIGKEMVCWRDLTPLEALRCMVQELDEVKL